MYSNLNSLSKYFRQYMFMGAAGFRYPDYKYVYKYKYYTIDTPIVPDNKAIAIMITSLLLGAYLGGNKVVLGLLSIYGICYIVAVLLRGSKLAKYMCSKHFCKRITVYTDKKYRSNDELGKEYIDISITKVLDGKNIIEILPGSISIKVLLDFCKGMPLNCIAINKFACSYYLECLDNG